MDRCCVVEGGRWLKCRDNDEKMVDKRCLSLGENEDVRDYFGKQGNFSPKVGVFCRKVLLFSEKVVDFLGECLAAFGEGEPFGQKGACFSWGGRTPSAIRLEI